ncbi:DNA polymerase III subunit gamma/tau, partial [Candidatus Curtissbacteria bacterium]|nr:DNA polymerase III subunit gamma/tau [Candidatus Curtissbacteria bacterium]
MTVFYRKYRPQKFADLVGQEKTREILLAQLTSGKIGHGYLFAGPRGTGKTSTARIFAKAVNCKSFLKPATGNQKQKFGEPCNKCISCLAVSDGSHLDLVEIDAASNRGIDEIRDLREKIKLAPVSCRFKVYVIDEAHMLTIDAFGAFLKTLEEPPAHAIFILCTTAAGKLPPTIISRLARFNFKRANDEEIVRALRAVAKSEGLHVEESAFLKIAKSADGSFRDGVSILDQLAARGEIR